MITVTCKHIEAEPAAETEVTKSWGDLPCGSAGKTVREAVAALRFDMAHNRWAMVAYRLARIEAEGHMQRIEMFAPEIRTGDDDDYGDG